MELLIDYDILMSFCEALDVEWTAVGEDSALFHTLDGEEDFVHCHQLFRPSPVRVEVSEEARTAYLKKIDPALKIRRRQLMDGVGPEDREEIIDETTALLVMRWLLQ
jgi:hypothetical protein